MCIHSRHTGRVTRVQRILLVGIEIASRGGGHRRVLKLTQSAQRPRNERYLCEGFVCAKGNANFLAVRRVLAVQQVHSR